MTSDIGVPAQPEDENKKDGDSLNVFDVVDVVGQGASALFRGGSGVPRIPATGNEPVLEAAAAVEAATTVAAETAGAGAEAAASVADAAGSVVSGVADVIGGIFSG